MDESYTYEAPPGSEAESAQVPAPAQTQAQAQALASAYSAPAPFPPEYSVADYDGGDGQGAEQAPEAPMNAGGNFAYMDDEMQAYDFGWPYDFDNELAYPSAAAPASMAGPGPGQSVHGTYGQPVPLGQANAYVPGYNLPVGAGQPPALALPGPSASVAQVAPVGQHASIGLAASVGRHAPVGIAAPAPPVGQHAPIGIAATAAPRAPIVPVAPQLVLPPGFRLQENHVLRHDWPQGALQPSPKHRVYERNRTPKPAQDNAIWCNSCEHWLWEPCYQRVPIGTRDHARCCNRCHWRKKRFRGMGLPQWLLAAQPRMMHLIKKDPGYVA